MKWILGLFVLGCFVVGCGSNEAEQSSSAVSAPSSTAPTQSLDPAQAGTLKGSIKFEGADPQLKAIPVRGNPECSVFHKEGTVPNEEVVIQNGVLQNVFIYVKEGLEGQSFASPTEPVVIDNKLCTYVPHVSGAQVGQPIHFTNSDATLHNIHSYSKSNKSFNMGLPFQGMKQVKTFPAPEVMVTLKCDVHPWMLGYLGVVSHPYFAVSGQDGGFELKDLPAGEYVIEAWHEKFGAQSQKIKIEPRQTAEIEFKFA